MKCLTVCEAMASPYSDCTIEPSPTPIEPQNLSPQREPSLEGLEQPSASSTRPPLEVAVERTWASHSALLSSLKTPDGLREKFHANQGMPVNFVLVGKYQVGKSALINAMFYNKTDGYKEIAEEADDLEPTTTEIQHHSFTVDGTVYHIYDTMGLQDGRKKESDHVKKIKDIFAKAHLVIYCTKLQEPIRPEDISALKTLTKKCDKSFWQNAVIALTFANAAAPNRPRNRDWFAKLLANKKETLHRCFIDDLGISQEVWDELSRRTVPVGNTINPALPGIEDWRADFWLECVDACAEEAKVSVAALAWKEEAFFPGACLGQRSFHRNCRSCCRLSSGNFGGSYFCHCCWSSGGNSHCCCWPGSCGRRSCRYSETKIEHII